ncbi:hypothetical protein HPB52_013978 [Rhipicephalus sanguineus]|uniref:Vesicle-fusing ATPase n=1 Tax=Rhipicephalus sanguineus TaxID=34632 RepID=A0A9D4TA72_RHISA|nr:hypothetical protein HPB52_013978 [Rhipicephalus sanguineus]
MPHLVHSHKFIRMLRGEGVVLVVTDLERINLPSSLSRVTMLSCFGHYFVLVLEKRERYDGQQQFFAMVQLIGSRNVADNFICQLELINHRRWLTLVFDDAYKSQQSCILVDNIERLLDYGPIGPRYSNLVLQALLVLLQKDPPKGRKLLVLCTSSLKGVLDEMGLSPSFTAVLRVPNLSLPQHVLAVLEDVDCFSKAELDQIAKHLEGRRLVALFLSILGWKIIE